MYEPTGEPEPIMVDCEGSGFSGHLITPTHLHPWTRMMCAMCGQTMAHIEPDAASDGEMPPHQRMDKLAMIERGDFDG